MYGQPTAAIVDQVRDIPIYHTSIAQGHFPILEKPQIADGFPYNWMTPRLAAALETGEAELVLSTGTDHARTQLIRPPLFLLKSYYRLWSEHPDISHTWRQGCARVSLTTVLATEHVARVNANKRGEAPAGVPGLDERRLDDRTMYVNLALDPALWQRDDVERMIGEIRAVADGHPQGLYHLDCSGYHLAHLMRKAVAWGLWDTFPQPASIVTAYEYTPVNVRAYLQRHFGVPIIDLFGSAELGYLFYSDGNSRYVPYLDRMSVELVPVTPGSQIYSVIVTSMRNPYMPLIRYRSGDCVRTYDGSPDPTKVSRICGRELELLATPNGPVSQGDLDDSVAAASSRVFTYKLRVTGQTEGRLDYTTFDGEPLDPSESAALAKHTEELTGVRYGTAHHARIPIGASGKYAWLATEP
ncbi:phenylacetate-CoA ligase [Sinosporangium album]|uniref:Phenylacetate-CoA ligase n=1 Tax=Sinosporangium album TaxID=504805 RepID=A0A1G8GBQ8_9ACTN|nr:hypothetical protein [Sinosporangium album]SDH91783.1 phenylacetate-CoA ligase [Sinosporangium album]